MASAAQRRRRRSSRLPPDFFSRVATAVGGFLILSLSAFFLAYRTSGGGIRVGSGAPRSAQERAQLLASGNCAVRTDGSVLGHVLAEIPVTKSNTQVRLQVEAADRRETLIVLATEVRVVACHSLP